MDSESLRVPGCFHGYPHVSQDQITTAPLFSFNFSDLMRDQSRFFTIKLDFDPTVKADGRYVAMWLPWLLT